ncbi:MAG: ATP phosphoribosyltransferase regulatory subunit [Pseudomonadales bacterium]|nr:ATP phosphoribosyltransferase regulatory subunit [Pseudomonadales bacterium]
MNMIDRWLLPDGIDEVLPPQAHNLERIRRQLLDIFASWGYDYVIPPMVEFLESLLTGTGRDLDLKTFKLTDQVSGRMMGIRADITPQVARIDAHSHQQSGLARMCYAGTVLHAKADNMLASRAPIQAGAELFGDTGTQGDIEIVSLMLQSLCSVGLDDVMVELGDVGIYRSLMSSAGLAREQEEQLFELIQKKAPGDLEALLQTLPLDDQTCRMISALPGLCGTEDVISRAQVLLAGQPDVEARLNSLSEVAARIGQRFPSASIYYDLSELRGYHYHTGLVFAAYHRPDHQQIAKGGRYDSVGAVFGRARGATGFTVDLKRLSVMLASSHERQTVAVASELSAGPALWEKLQALRSDGYVVLETSSAAAEADFVLIQSGDGFELAPSN